ncbi:MAG: glycosyltransferase family 2 protein [Paludibacteraceae bacterium]|nr:glycosyltransferase family 2 protein [Paludibacteraceae bacterium]
MKRICAITMARNDTFFLKKWVSYYGAQLGEENLYIWLDGKDQEFEDYTGPAHVEAVERIGGQVVAAEKQRLRFLSDRQAELLGQYDIVIGVDADEFLLVDPALNQTLGEYLSGLTIRTSVSGLGLDVGQHLGEEGPINASQPFLQQRHYAVLSSRYTKPSVVNRPVLWGSGFHRVKGHNFHIDKHLYLLHFGYFDDGMIQARFSDADRMAAGWGRHIAKRTRTIRQVTSLKARNADRYMPIARFIQTWFRPFYAINKPAMAGIKWVVRIPDRFGDIV